MQGAGGGRPPKPANERRNRNKPTREPLEVPQGQNPAKDGPPKPLVTLNAAGKRIWESIWRSPSASQWREGDLPALSRMVWLQQDPQNCRVVGLLAEMRQLEDRFGLNPYARRQMKWEETPAKDPTQPGPSKPARSPDRKAETLKLLHGKTA